MARPRKYQIYCDPVDLHDELLIRIQAGTTSDKLAKMYLSIIKGIGTRPNFSGYFGEMRDEMEFTAIYHLLKYTHNYDPIYFKTNKNAAFTYCSRIVFQCFTMTITAVKKRQEKEDIIQAIIEDDSYTELRETIAENLYGEHSENLYGEHSEGRY